MLDIIIVAAGRGQRFKDQADVFPEFNQPKPMIPVAGKSILERTLYSFPDWFWESDQVRSITFGVREMDTPLPYFIRSLMMKRYGEDVNAKTRVICLSEEQRGNLHTAYQLGLRLDDEDCELLILDADNYHDSTELAEILLEGRSYGHSMTVGFPVTEIEDPKWCFAVADSGMTNGDDLWRVDSISEKKWPALKSNQIVFAMMGVFWFYTAEKFLDDAERVLLIPRTGEYYMSEALDRGNTFIYKLPNHVALGTPEDVAKVDSRYLLFDWVAPPPHFVSRCDVCKVKHWPHCQLRICFDLDGTLCHSRKPGESYADVKPILGASAMLRDLRGRGAHVIIYTARHMKTCEGNIGLIMAKQGKVTLDWLERHGFVYDEIHFGKPHADVFVCDKSYNHPENSEWTSDKLEHIFQQWRGE